MVLSYSQRWILYYEKRKLMFNTDDQVPPRHLSTGKCLCQFVEDHINKPPQDKSKPRSLQLHHHQQHQLKQQQQSKLTSIIAKNSCVQAIDTLSGLVDLKEKQQGDNLKTDSNGETLVKNMQLLQDNTKILNNPYYNNTLSNSFYVHSWQQKLGDNFRITMELPPQQSPKQVNPAEVSLNIISSDDLVKKLRLLFVSY